MNNITTSLQFLVLLAQCFLGPIVIACEAVGAGRETGAASGVLSEPLNCQTQPGNNSVGKINEERPNNDKPPPIPPLGDILSITAESYSHPLSPLVPDLPPFDVPQDRFGELLVRCRGMQQFDDADQAAKYEIGCMWLKLKDETSLRICWYWEGQKGRMHLSLDGHRYLTTGAKFAADETLAFDSLVRKIAADKLLQKEK